MQNKLNHKDFYYFCRYKSNPITIAGGKWDGMMTQKHIGYTSWNDDFPADTMPEVFRFDNSGSMTGNYVFQPETDGVVVKSTLAFRNLSGHRYAVSIDGGEEKTVNFNHNLNEEPQNIYDVFYPIVARRVVEKNVPLTPGITTDGMHEITIRPLDEGIVFEKIVVDYGGYSPSYLFMDETPVRR